MRRIDSTSVAVCSMIFTSACGSVPDRGGGSLAASEQALAPEPVMGFEQASYWTASAGTVSASSEHTEGSASLAVGGFTYTRLRSAEISTPSNVTETLALDIKPPVSPSWGQVQLFVTIPSQNTYNSDCTAASIAGLPADRFSTVTFTCRPDAVAAMKKPYTDLRFTIAANAPQSMQGYLFDNLRFTGAAQANRVELRVSNVEGQFYVTVDGIRRKVYTQRDADLGRILNVSSWFASGNNAVRFQSVNTGASEREDYSIELWVDGVLVLRENCPSTECSAPVSGIISDRTIGVSTPNRPPRQTVQLTSSAPGKLYIDDVYTGRSTPATLSLPPGTYKFGLGVSQDQPFNYSGAYYETAASVAAVPVSLNLTSGQPVPVRNSAKIVIVPIERTLNYVDELGREDESNTGLLTPSDVEQFFSQADETRDVWFGPFSYGLATLNITKHEMVTNAPFRERNHDGFENGCFLQEANLLHLYDEFDVIVLFFSQHKNATEEVVNSRNGAYAIDKFVGIHTASTRGISAERPNPFLLHELLHHYEGYNEGVLGLYNGVSGLHGAGEHGYPDEGSSGETDFVKFYRLFMRGQVAEIKTMREGVAVPAPPATADMYVGVFQALSSFTNAGSTPGCSLP